MYSSPRWHNAYIRKALILAETLLGQVCRDKGYDSNSLTQEHRYRRALSIYIPAMNGLGGLLRQKEADILSTGI